MQSRESIVIHYVAFATFPRPANVYQLKEEEETLLLFNFSTQQPKKSRFPTPEDVHTERVRRKKEIECV